MKRVIQLVVLGGAMFVLALWLTREPTEPGSDALRRTPRETGAREIADPRLRGGTDTHTLATEPSEGYVLRGIVVDESGQPVVDVPVLIEHKPSRPRHVHATWSQFEQAERGRDRRVEAGTSRTDTEGRFVFPGLRPKQDYACVLTPPAPFVGMRRSVYKSAPGELEMRCVLLRGTPLRGRVVDASGTGIRAFVSAHVRIDDERMVWLPRRETDAQGRFELAAAPVGRAFFDVAVRGRGRRYGLTVPLPAAGEVVLPFRIADGGTVRGRVTDTSGTPVAAARLLITLNRPDLGEGVRVEALAVTNDEGRYASVGLDPGRLEGIAADAPGFAHVTGLYGGFPLAPGDVFEADVVLARGVTVKGRVLDETGQPVSGAVVTLRIEWPSRGRVARGARRSTPADSDGRFVFSELRPLGVGTLSAYAPHAATSPSTEGPSAATVLLETESPVLEHDLVLAAIRPVPGRIVDGTGTPVAGAQVRATSREALDRVYDGVPIPTAVSDAEGRFVLAGMLPGEAWRFEARTAGLRLVPEPAVLIPRPPTPLPEIALELRPGAEIRGQLADGVRVVREPLLEITGTVVDQDGEPLVNASVMFRKVGGRDGSSRGLATTRVGGKFRLRVRAGSYSVWARGGDTLSPIEAGTTDLKLHTTTATSKEVVGTVVDADGRPVARAKVTVWTRDSRGLHGHGGVCTMGRFLVPVETTNDAGDLLIDDPCDAVGRPLNLRPQIRTDVSLDGDPVQIRLEPGRAVAGRVVDETGQGVSEVRIECSIPHGAASTFGEYARHADMPRARTRADGRFVLIGLGAERVRLRAVPDAPWIRPGVEDAVPGRDEVLFRLTKGHELRGRVLDPAGKPVQGAEVIARWVADGRPREASGRSDAEGAFHVTRLGPGPLAVRVVDRRGTYWPYRPLEIEGVEADTVDLELRLVSGSALSGVVVDPDGQPVPGATVFVHPANPRRSTTTLRADAQGRFLAAVLDAGPYRVEAHRGPVFAPSGRVEIEVPTQGVRLVLGRTWLLHGTVVGRPRAQKQVRFVYRLDGEPRLEGAGFSEGDAFSLRVRTNQPGTLLLLIEATGEVAVLENVRPGTGPHRLVPEKGATIEGRIEGGTPKPDVTDVTGIDDRGIRIRGPVLADGTFRIRGVPPGAYDLQVWADLGRGTRRFTAKGVDSGAKGIPLREAP